MMDYGTSKETCHDEVEQGIGHTDDRISGKYRTDRQRELYTGLIKSLTSWFIR